VKDWKSSLAALVIFSAGTLAGSAWTSLQAKTRREQEFAKRQTIPLMLWQRFEQLRRVERQLELTADQRLKIETQIREAEERFRKLWEPLAPTAHAELQQLRSRVLAEMKPEQRAKFEEMLRQRPLGPFGPRPASTNAAPSDPKDITNSPPVQPAAN
jgi:hypothetical protein